MQGSEHILDNKHIHLYQQGEERVFNVGLRGLRVYAMVEYWRMGVNELDIVVVYRRRWKTTIMAANALCIINKILSNAFTCRLLSGFNDSPSKLQEKMRRQSDLLIAGLDTSPLDFLQSKVMTISSNELCSLNAMTSCT